MTGPYVPAVDLDPIRQRADRWREQHAGQQWPCCSAHASAEDVPALIAEVEHWRRLYVRVEPAPFEHSDMCEDGDIEKTHLRDSMVGPACRCICPKCDSNGYCICPRCSRPVSHAHREATP